MPRHQPVGFKKCRKRAPGVWFNSATLEEYDRLYRTEILDRLDPRVVADELRRWRVPVSHVLACFERPG